MYLEFHIPEAVVVETTEYLLYDLGSFVGEVGLLYKTKNLWNCFTRDVCPSLMVETTDYLMYDLGSFVGEVFPFNLNRQQQMFPCISLPLYEHYKSR